MQPQPRGVRRYWWALPIAAGAGLTLAVVLTLGSNADPGAEPGPNNATASVTPPPMRTDTTARSADPAGAKPPDETTGRPTGELARAYRPQELATPADQVEASHGNLVSGVGFAARWDSEGRYLLVTTFGSSSCAHGLDLITLVGPQRIELSTGLDESVARSCTADLAPFRNEIVVPEGVDRGADLTIILGDRHLTLPAQN